MSLVNSCDPPYLHWVAVWLRSDVDYLYNLIVLILELSEKLIFSRELKEHFSDYTEQVVKLMVPMLKFYFHDGVRTAAAESLPLLLECAKIKGPAYLQEMWAFMLPDLLKVIEVGNKIYEIWKWSGVKMDNVDPDPPLTKIVDPEPSKVKRILTPGNDKLEFVWNGVMWEFKIQLACMLNFGRQLLNTLTKNWNYYLYKPFVTQTMDSHLLV